VTVKERLIARVAEMDDQEAADLLRLLDLPADDEPLTAAELTAIEEARADVAAGRVLTADEAHDLFG
jgi:hypothetical protein